MSRRHTRRYEGMGNESCCGYGVLDNDCDTPCLECGVSVRENHGYPDGEGKDYADHWFLTKGMLPRNGVTEMIQEPPV